MTMENPQFGDVQRDAVFPPFALGLSPWETSMWWRRIHRAAHPSKGAVFFEMASNGFLEDL